MRIAFARPACVLWAAGVVALSLTITSPGAAQFGGLKKKLKAAAAPEQAAEPAQAAEAAPAADGGAGVVVLTPDVVERMIAGLRAGQAERKAAEKEDTPYGRYHRGVSAYEQAKPKCLAGQQSFPNRMAGNDKMSARYSAFVDKMVEAQVRGDTKAQLAWADSGMAMQDPACLVKQPEQPERYYEMQREVETRAEEKSIKTSGFSRAEFAQLRERAEASLRGGPNDLSESERRAVSSRASELKPALGIQDAPQPTPAEPAPAPAPAQPAPAVPAGTSAMQQCMIKNAQKHQKEIEALGQRAQAAQQASNTAALMAIADTLQQLQMAGCTGDR
jgi:hypothetical protein